MGPLEVPGLREEIYPLGQKVWPGRDARKLADLAVLVDRPRVATPQCDFFVRTEVPDGWCWDGDTASWRIRVTGLKKSDALDLNLDRLRCLPQESVRVAVECSGNVMAFAFGLLSLGEWRGVPWRQVVELLAPSGVHAGATHVEIKGFDEESRPSNPPRGFCRSGPGASWIFALDDLEAHEALLALELGGEPLDLDHGAPVRLVVPGWYGCSNIKWVEELRFCDASEPSTAQMREFAGRTGQQQPPPTLAKAWLPATMPFSATLCKAEQWASKDGHLVCLLKGLLWGGEPGAWEDKLSALSLSIFLENASKHNRETDVVKVEMDDNPAGGRWEWQAWRAAWVAPRPGMYRISLRAPRARPDTWKINHGAFDRLLRVVRRSEIQTDG